MPNYKYRVIFEDGRIGRGKIIASSRISAIEKLKMEKNQPIMIKRMGGEKAKYNTRVDYSKLKKPTVERRKKKNRPKINIMKLTLEDLKKLDLHPFARVKTKDIVTFVNNIYILKKAKFNNVQALEAVYQGTENPAFKDIIEDLLIGVQSGEKLNTIMEGYPKVFPPMFVNFVRVGEESGNLDTALLYARDYVESSQKLNKRIKAAIIPRVLQFVGIMIAMFVALIIGVPILKDVYAMFGSEQEIPKATMIGFSIAEWLIANWYIPTIIIALLVGAFIVYIRTPRGRYNWDKFLVTGPVVGKLIDNIIVSNFFQAMLLNLKNGMRIQESLEVSKNVTNNYYFLSAVEAGKVNIQSGESWIEPFDEKNLFKPMVSEMLNIGMKTELSEMMDKVNEYIKTEIDESLARFVKVLPDITYLFVGIAMIALVITVVVPLTNVYMGGFISLQ